MMRNINTLFNKKILVESMHGIGDTVCILPMLSVIRSEFPNAELYVLVKNQAAKQIIEASRIKIDKIIVLDIYKNILNTIKIIFYLRKMNFEIGISSVITPVRKSKIFMRLIGVNQHMGLQRKNKNIDSFCGKMHFVEANIKMLDGFCNAINEKIEKPQLFSSDNSFIKFGNSENLKIGICIGNADYTLKNRTFRIGKIFPKAWGINKFKKLIKLLSVHNIDIILIGGKLEENLLPELKEFKDIPNIFNFVGKLNMKESIDMISGLDYIVGVDTGMMHVAAALNIPTISIYGPTNPNVTAPYRNSGILIENQEICKYCYGTKLYISCEHRKCLYNITPDIVYNKIIEFMNK